MAQAPDHFTEQDYRDADSFLESAPTTGTFISDLLSAAQSFGRSETVQTLVYLLALRDYGEKEQDAELEVNTADRCFVVEPFWGDDLLIRPPTQNMEEHL